MDSIDYRGALTRGWRLLVALAVLGLVIGLILPTSGAKSQWTSDSSVGSAPPSLAQSSVLSPGITTDQILFYAGADATLLGAGKLAHSTAPLFVIRNSIHLQGPGTNSSGVATGQPGVINVKVVAPTIQQSVDLNNGFDASLAYAVTAAAILAVTNEEHQISSTIATIEGQLASQQFPAGVTATGLEAQLSALQTRLAALAVTPTDTGYVVLQPAVPYTVTRTK